MEGVSEPAVVHHEEAEKPQRRKAGNDAETHAPPLGKAARSGPPKQSRKTKGGSRDAERKVIGVEERMTAAAEALDEKPLMDVEVGIDDEDRAR